ncbi:MAG: methyltransferase domain-containing protein [gamma proteobacterium symbiont of Lucinoma myriamae]|nr:methyltransferase domain-containing protein [gamma proteobacterium symbiont of Lucinoma myriamae]
MIDERHNLSILIDVQWHDELATYKDRNFVLKTNFWRDFYPAVFDYQIKRAELNQTLNINYKAGELLEDEFNLSKIQTISVEKFNRYYSGPIAIEPTVGRFYPRGMIEGVADCFKMDNRPFRVLAKTDDSLKIDLNHPLARHPIQVTATITDVFDANQQNGGRCIDIAETITTNGPGFQIPLRPTPFDFSQGMPFIRKMEDDDAVFYDAIDTIPVVDQAALEQLTQFYSQYLKDNSTILDLMAGPDSHIPDNLENIDVTGLGLKEQDLKENPALNQYTLHDLNQQPELPFDDQQFDAVICSFSVEYMVQPVKVFQQISRILKHGGVLLVGFSDRFFEKKAIGLWDDLHTFERVGIVLEYFRQAGEFEDLHAESIRGLIRHNNDPFINKNVFLCPMFMLSGKRKG